MKLFRLWNHHTQCCDIQNFRRDLHDRELEPRPVRSAQIRSPIDRFYQLFIYSASVEYFIYLACKDHSMSQMLFVPVEPNVFRTHNIVVLGTITSPVSLRFAPQWAVASFHFPLLLSITTFPSFVSQNHLLISLSLSVHFL